MKVVKSLNKVENNGTKGEITNQGQFLLLSVTMFTTVDCSIGVSMW